MLRRAVAIIVVTMIAASACSSDDSTVAQATSTTTSTDSVASSSDIDAAAVTLDSIDVGGDVATFAPRGWAVAADGTATPPASDGSVVWRIDDACPDPCVAMSEVDWEDHVGSVEFSPLLGSNENDVVADESSPGRRRLELSGDGVLHVVIVRWADGASGYIRCELRGPDVDVDALAAALDFACDTTRAALDG